MNCPTPCQAHLSNQGKGCECDRMASRAALGIRDDQPFRLRDLPAAIVLALCLALIGSFIGGM